ncbi:hypothetical protein D3C71_1403530 [compost metagenome]
MPAFGGWALVVPQNDTVAGEWQGRAIPVIAPLLGIGKFVDGVAVRRGWRKTQFLQPFDALRHTSRTFGPVPDKQANPGRLLGAQIPAGH